MVKAKQLAHLVLRVRDLERSERFYSEFLGLRVTNRRDGAIGKMVFMSAGEASSHELALISVGADAPGPDENRVGIWHHAWAMDSFEDLKSLYADLKQKGVNIGGIGSHNISIGVYFFDPDGNEIEAYFESPRETWPKEGDLFEGDFPQSLEEPAKSPA